MPIICPTITAYSPAEYKEQMEKVAGFAHRIQIDLTDGLFTREKTIEPEQAWWTVGTRADFHLMYRDPAAAVQKIMQHKPSLIIIHAEADGDFEDFANFCHQRGVQVGVALLQESPANTLLPALHMIDHVLIFSGNLGYQGGSQADLGLLGKVHFLKIHKPELEIGWDGGINDQNVSQLVFGGVDVLNVGGFIQSSQNPARTFESLQRIADETGTT
jgi:ribulose-phosphate 3-epimerase